MNTETKTEWRPVPVSWLTDRESMYFDKEDARRDCDGFVTPLYDHAKPCERCAGAEQIEATATMKLGQALIKIDALEAEKCKLALDCLAAEDQASDLFDENARLTNLQENAIILNKEKSRTIAQQADQIKQLTSRDLEVARTIEDLLHSKHSLSEQLAAAQAKIDELMFEYCPSEMTPEQLLNYSNHQQAATPKEQQVIDAAIAAQKEGK